MQQFPELTKIAALQGGTHASAQGLHFVERLDCRASRFARGIFLLPQDGPGLVGRAGEEQHEVGLQLTQHRRLYFDRST